MKLLRSQSLRLPNLDYHSRHRRLEHLLLREDHLRSLQLLPHGRLRSLRPRCPERSLRWPAHPRGMGHEHTVGDMEVGTLPRIPIPSCHHLTDDEVPEEFKIVYQCTTTRHGPLCRRSSARVFFRVQQVARVMSICPAMRLGRLRARIQVFAPIAHCALSQYLWGNHGYNGLKKSLQQASEAALEWETNEALQNTSSWKGTLPPTVRRCESFSSIIMPNGKMSSH